MRCWHGGLGPGVRRPILLGQCCVRGVGCSELALLQPINVVAELERGAQLQPHVLHHHVTAQQQQGLAIDLLWAGRRCQQPDCIPTQGFPTSGPAVTFRSPESLPCPMSLQQLTSYWKAPQPFLHCDSLLSFLTQAYLQEATTLVFIQLFWENVYFPCGQGWPDTKLTLTQAVVATWGLSIEHPLKPSGSKDGND